uniref:Uncharacterized protein n=1 Tax=Rhizophagus irregularis (strain DAOM 181602 / DAOM 197198 / MUCL 43194) TaxID=747089 RepID=U9TPN7_RHIID
MSTTNKIAPYFTYKITTYKMFKELEEKIKKLREELNLSGLKPYKGHEEVLLFLNQNKHITCSESVDKAGINNKEKHIAKETFQKDQ